MPTPGGDPALPRATLGHFLIAEPNYWTRNRVKAGRSPSRSDAGGGLDAAPGPVEASPRDGRGPSPAATQSRPGHRGPGSGTRGGPMPPEDDEAVQLLLPAAT